MTYEEYCNKVYMDKDYYLGLSAYVEGLFAEDVMKNQCGSSESTPDKYKLYNPPKDAIEFYNIPEDILNNYVAPLILTKEEKKSYLICEILSDNF